MDFNLAGIYFEYPLMNAAGTCKLLEGSDGVRELARSASAAVMVGSITLEPREDNSGESYWASELFSLNLRSLANPGSDFYLKYLPEMVKITHGSDKPLLVSAAGFNPSEYAILSQLALEAGADLVEENLSCPNIWQESRQERIACFDLQLVGEILFCLEKELGKEAKVAVKISPFSDPFALNELAKVIGASKIVKAVTAVNTFPNAFSFDEKGKPRISSGGGLAGMGGAALKPISLGQVRQLREVLPERIQVMGAGGISTGQDVLDYLRAGAIAVQMATSILKRKGVNVFSRILTELTAVY